MMPEKTRILIADDHAMVRKSIQGLLEGQPDLEVVATAVNGREAITLTELHRPDVIIMDVSMPELDGISAAGEIRARGFDTHVIILSMHVNNTLVQQARQNGVASYVIKQKAHSDLLPAVRAARNGSTEYFPT